MKRIQNIEYTLINQWICLFVMLFALQNNVYGQEKNDSKNKLEQESLNGKVVKIGIYSNGISKIIGSSKLDENGDFEFKNFAADIDSVYFEFLVLSSFGDNQRPQVQRWSIPAYQFEDAKKAAPKSMVKKFSLFEVTITIMPDENKTSNLNLSKSNINRASNLNLSKSNIRGRVRLLSHLLE